MSIYDDLANSAYMDKDQFRQQLEQAENPLEASHDESQNSINFNQFSESARVNQEDNYSQNRESFDFKFGVDRTPVHLQDLQVNQQEHNPYQNIKIPTYGGGNQMNQNQLQAQNYNNKYINRDLFGGREDDDYFKQKSNNYYNYDQQYDQRNVVLEDEDVIHAQNYNQQQQQLGYMPPANENQTSQSIHLDNFKMQNDQISQLLQQLQAPHLSQFSAFNTQNIQQTPSINQSLIVAPPSRPVGGKFIADDNSILALAQNMGNSGNSGNEPLGTGEFGRANMDLSPMDGNYILKDSNSFRSSNQFQGLPQIPPYPQAISNPQPTNNDFYNYNSMMSQQNTNMHQQQQQIEKPRVNQNYQRHTNPVYDQENLDFNIIQGQQHQRVNRAESYKDQQQYVAPLKYHQLNRENSFPDRIAQQQEKQQLIPSQKTAFYNQQQTEEDLKRKRIMEHFDDIPIKQLNNTEGYQAKTNETKEEELDEESDKPLTERVDSSKWKVRQKAYNDIRDLFYVAQSKLNAPKQNTHQDDDDEENESEEKVFDTYGQLMEKIISEHNLIALHDALACLKAYLQCAPEIKSIIFKVQNILLDKVQLNKPNLRSATMDILMLILKKDKTISIMPELIRRFKNKNTKLACFAMEVTSQAVQKKLISDQSSLKTIFKAMQDNLVHQNREIRDQSQDLLKELYKNCQDDASSFIKNIKNLRPQQLKEVKELLSEQTKTQKSNLILMFPDQPTITASEGSSPKTKPNKGKDEFYDDQEEDSTENSGKKEKQESDLSQLVPENFNEIAYITQINIKKKGMESFNQELEKMISRKQQAANKDYTQIYNVVQHMLEDSNALVFMEAIKTVEYLSILLGKNIKAQKLRLFVSLLAEKFKETKSAVISGVNKALSQIIKSQNMSLPSLIEYMVGTIAHNNKNARVKQLILEKVDQTLQEEEISQEELINVFKAIKDKIINFIQKETNASVRDAAVQLLTTFKMFLPNSPLVSDAVNTLPKYRITEINKKASESVPNKTVQKQPSKKQSDISQPNKDKKEAGKESSQEFSYKGRTISSQFQIHLAQIIRSLQKISSGNIEDVQTLKIKWEDTVEKLGEEGIQEAKPVMVSCVHWLLSNFSKKLKFDQNQDLLVELLTLLKTIYCIDRSVERNEDGHSDELDQAIEITLLSSQWIQNKKQTETLLNVIQSASGSILTFIGSLKQALTKQKQQRNLNKIMVLQFTFNWLHNSIDQLLFKGLVFSDLEEFRSIGIKYMEESGDEDEKQQIVSIMARFTNVMQERKKQMAYLDESAIEHKDDHDDQDKEEVSGILEGLPGQQYNRDPNYLKYSEMSEPVKKSKGQEIVELISRDFEKGLLMIKELPKLEESKDFKTKEMIFAKLLNIIEHNFKNPQQQYQQAYALKALLWMKEEIMGLEDCFKFTDQVMMSFARTEKEGRDSSVELYLLNHWVKDLSLRDLIDRVSTASGVNPEDYFTTLFKWLMNQRLNGVSSDEKWAIEDFRKIALYLAKNVYSDDVKEFMTQCVDKFGLKKVREFMEIQLMHSTKDYNKFMDWFNQNFKSPSIRKESNLVLPSINIENIERDNKQGRDYELQNALKSHIDESACSSARGSSAVQHSQLYQQRREKMKEQLQKKNVEEVSTSNKYEDIISRLEAQLQQPKQSKQEESKEESKGYYKTQKSQQQSNYEPSKRYESTMNNLSQEEEKELEEDEYQIIETEDKLKQSQIKESRYKDEIEMLERERQRIEEERSRLLQAKNKEDVEWKRKYEHMKEEHEDVVGNLQEANKCYMTQVSENEELKQQLKLMSQQHIAMMKKFEEFESKIANQQKQHEQEKQFKPSAIDNSPELRNKKQGIQIVKEDQLARIQEAFTNVGDSQMMRYQSENELVIKKIQDLFLNAEKNGGEEIGQPLFFYFSRQKSYQDKVLMIQEINKSLQNEDVLYALSVDTYQALLQFLLKAFAMEKAKLERDSVNISQSTNKGGAGAQNDITTEIQKIVSILLNSKEFTTSLVSLFKILRLSMPDDLSLALSEENKQLLRVTMRCVHRITKALHSENPDLVRAFDVLFEMQKLFIKHPPELLREDLPSLQEFDYVYRGLKDVSDKLMELHPQRVMAFLKFVSDKPANAFTRYMSQVMQSKVQEFGEFEDDEEEDFEGYTEGIDY